MDELVELLISKGLTISSCESFTGGLFASTITSIAGVSSVYKGSIIAYHNDIKKDVLCIDEQIFNDYGVISANMALEMVKKCIIMFDTDICVSFTGNAGPNQLENKEVGLWYLAILYKNKSYVYEFKDSGNRNSIRIKAVNDAVGIIKDIIRNY